MAKNKNRKQAGPQNRVPRAEQAQEEVERLPGDTAPPLAQPQGSPADVARKQQRRFGHN
ncbi:hypothetical protein [Streptomyces poonensis]|uniref:Small hydrophilic protein n=1 Tax=Streptomyces poonensis TaxID=68255 RepID=A0A918Q4E3_9ACTN|nr:hypothetical protein [Streptomyces poonensis]GGZ31356.1 hypothetical protein GCM10010365_60090 [Streptomyces poonensis]GLJ88334.1 hypothetical protein GCM10017589_09340 [Streptomyces poonensis]